MLLQKQPFASAFLSIIVYFGSFKAVWSDTVNQQVNNFFTDFANALCDPIAYHQEEKRQQQLQSLLDEEEVEEVGIWNMEYS